MAEGRTPPRGGPSRRRFGPLSVLLIGQLLGCASTAARSAASGSPEDATRALAQAIERGDVAAAYRTMHPRVRSEMDFSAFASAFADNEAELRALAGRLRTRDLETRAVAELTLPSGEVVTLVYEGGAFRLSGALLDGHALATPRDAVVALHRALLRRDLPALLRVLTRQRRAAWLAALGRGLDATADPLDLKLEIRGDRALVIGPNGARIQLRKQAGTWHVSDIE